MIDFEIKEYTLEEQKADMLKELSTIGLHDSVKRRCDLINDECAQMGYATHRYIQELMREILELIRLKEKK